MGLGGRRASGPGRNRRSHRPKALATCVSLPLRGASVRTASRNCPRSESRSRYKTRFAISRPARPGRADASANASGRRSVARRSSRSHAAAARRLNCSFVTEGLGKGELDRSAELRVGTQQVPLQRAAGPGGRLDRQRPWTGARDRAEDVARWCAAQTAERSLELLEELCQRVRRLRRARTVSSVGPAAEATSPLTTIMESQ